MRIKTLLFTAIFLLGMVLPGDGGCPINPHDYEYTGSIISVVTGDNHIDKAGDAVMVYAGDECRGVSTLLHFEWMESQGRPSWFHLIMVYSNVESEPMDIIYYDNDTGRVRGAWSINFEADMIVGHPFYPLILNIDTVENPLKK